MTKISIITVNLNNKAGLRKTIESVVNQTYKDIEYIVIDGGSTDGSVDVINEYADKINYWVSEPDKGIYNAMNKGIVKATGEYLQFLNSGDWLCDNEVIEKVSQEIKWDDEIVIGNLVLDYEGRFIVKTNPRRICAEHFLKRGITHQSTFIKRDLFEKYGYYDENLTIASDYDFFINVLAIKNANYKFINLNISYFDVNGIGTIESTEETRINENEIVINRYFSKPVIETLEKYNKVKFIVESKWFIFIFNFLFNLVKSLSKFKKKMKLFNIFC